MEDIKQMQATLAKLEKSISLNQIAKRSGINYVTLMNIKKNKSKRVTDSVKQRFDAFVAEFTGTAAAPKVDAPAEKIPGKRGPKKGSKRAAKKAPAKKAAKKAAKKVTVKKATRKKPGPKPGRRKAAAKVPTKVEDAPSKLDFASPVLGQALDREIEIAEARLEYLKSLREIEDEFLKAVGRK